jgi:hypothetical protein
MQHTSCSEMARRGRRRWALLLRRGAMIRQPLTREPSQTPDRLRLSAAGRLGWTLIHPGNRVYAGCRRHPGSQISAPSRLLLTRSGHRAGAQHSCCKIVGPADDHAVHCNRPGLRFSSHRWQLIPRVRSRSRRRDGPRSAILSARNLRPLPSAADDLPQPHERGLSWCWPAFSEELQHRLSNRGWLLQEHEVTSPWHIDEPHPFSQALA